MARSTSLAAHWRAHREAFGYALEHGITPRQAELELAREKAAANNREATARLALRMGSASTPPFPNPVSSQQAFENSQRLLGERDDDQTAAGGNVLI